jgi:tRNA threonylcarbamoyladenosine biosynthesis protein TsaE
MSMGSETVRIRLQGPGETEALGRALGERLAVGQGLALVGELGSGKTCLARGVALGLGVDHPEGVCSPTYLLVMEHPGNTAMLHLDAYLKDKSRAFLLDGGLDYLNEFQGVVVIEWAEKLADLLPEESLWVELQHTGDLAHPTRDATLDPRSSSAFPWLGQIPELFPISVNREEPPVVDPKS